jgi:GH25 family lysozyme M1 (1,4-beta-N-acetylmuramidase)
MNKEYNRDVAINAIKQLHNRNNVKTLNQYSKIVDKIATTGDTGGTYHDTWYCNYTGALQDWFELKQMVESLDIKAHDRINGICRRLDKALIVAKTIDKMNKLEDILDKNIQYG